MSICNYSLVSIKYISINLFLFFNLPYLPSQDMYINDFISNFRRSYIFLCIIVIISDVIFFWESFSSTSLDIFLNKDKSIFYKFYFLMLYFTVMSYGLSVNKLLFYLVGLCKEWRFITCLNPSYVKNFFSSRWLVRTSSSTLYKHWWLGYVINCYGYPLLID